MRNKIWLAIIISILVIPMFTACNEAPEPTVKEGRFNFSVTYEVDGEVTTVSSAYVCELEDSGWEIGGWYISWNEYIEDSELANRLKQTRGYLLLKTVDDGEIFLDFNLSAGYFMSEPNSNNENMDGSTESLKPRLFIDYSEAKYEEIGLSYEDDEAVLEGYGVRIISFEYDPPINNTYKNL